MKASKSSVVAVLVAVAIGGVALMVAACSSGKTNKKAETTAATQAVQETETAPEDTEALEYVTDENWETMAHVYRIIMDNYDTAKDLVASGQEDPSDVVQRADDIIEFGKSCERDNLLNQEAEEVLYDMVDTADGMLKLIKDGGGEIVEIPVEEETSVDGQESQEGAEGAGGAEDGSVADEADGAEDTGNTEG